jgi:WD40 repeat protein
MLLSRMQAQRHIMLSVHMRCGVPTMPRDIPVTVCPLSMMTNELPRVVCGSEESVLIYNLNALKQVPSANGGAQHGAFGILGGLLSGTTGSQGALGRPLLVLSLKGHRGAVSLCSWNFDETLLASADCDGLLIVWERGNV